MENRVLHKVYQILFVEVQYFFHTEFLFTSEKYELKNWAHLLWKQTYYFIGLFKFSG